MAGLGLYRLASQPLGEVVVPLDSLTSSSR
jgi:hypothetical protein